MGDILIEGKIKVMLLTEPPQGIARKVIHVDAELLVHGTSEK